VKKEDTSDTGADLERQLQNNDSDEELEKPHGFEEDAEENDDKWEIPAFLRRKKK
jgi:hypothetical protein